MRDSFYEQLREWYPSIDGSTVGGVGFITQPMRDVVTPAVEEVVLLFNSSEALIEYIEHRDYTKTDGRQRVRTVPREIGLSSVENGWNRRVCGRDPGDRCGRRSSSTEALQRGTTLCA